MSSCETPLGPSVPHHQKYDARQHRCARLGRGGGGNPKACKRAVEDSRRRWSAYGLQGGFQHENPKHLSLSCVHRPIWLSDPSPCDSDRSPRRFHKRKPGGAPSLQSLTTQGMLYNVLPCKPPGTPALVTAGWREQKICGTTAKMTGETAAEDFAGQPLVRASQAKMVEKPSFRGSFASCQKGGKLLRIFCDNPLDSGRARLI